ncbi:MAG: PTS IIA-like nitrogen-regulatory protein PtsN [Kordiimonas sp.]|nr:PTS IIA-like nitrogen-regulatory protein PtsN [Kordiimonas sp.]|tara:strand:- start:590 stop:1057 length:468 start_codon:yes stop_codon:yes gene_type:complete
MDMIELLDLGAVMPSLKASSKKQLLQEMSSRAEAVTGIPARRILDVILDRERLGTTGVGRGVAIPHGKLPELDRLYGVFARLEAAVDFEAIDDQPVDLVFMLLAPEEAGADHLKALARISRLLRDHGNCEKLRGSDSADALYTLLTDKTTSSNAA